MLLGDELNNQNGKAERCFPRMVPHVNARICVSTRPRSPDLPHLFGLNEGVSEAG
jgi:hypothetical protein